MHLRALKTAPIIPVLDPSDLEYVRSRYQERIARHGVTVAALNAGTPEKRQILYGAHRFAMPATPCAVLDIGCGLAGFYEYLKKFQPPSTYVGYDIIPEFVQACGKTYPNAQFHVRNIFEEGIQGIHDVIVMSQTLNNRYQRSDNVDVMKTALRLCFEHARFAVSVDMLSIYVDYQEGHLFYYSPEEIFRFAKTLTRYVRLRHDHHPFEFCIQLFHDAGPEHGG